MDLSYETSIPCHSHHLEISPGTEPMLFHILTRAHTHTHTSARAHTHTCGCPSVAHPPSSLLKPQTKGPRTAGFPVLRHSPAVPKQPAGLPPPSPQAAATHTPDLRAKAKRWEHRKCPGGTGEGQRGWGMLTLKIRLSVALPAKWFEDSRELQFGTHKLQQNLGQAKKIKNKRLFCGEKGKLG